MLFFLFVLAVLVVLVVLVILCCCIGQDLQAADPTADLIVLCYTRKERKERAVVKREEHAVKRRRWRESVLPGGGLSPMYIRTYIRTCIRMYVACGHAYGPR